jgi:hypothetical protein
MDLRLVAEAQGVLDEQAAELALLGWTQLVEGLFQLLVVTDLHQAIL